MDCVILYTLVNVGSMVKARCVSLVVVMVDVEEVREVGYAVHV